MKKLSVILAIVISLIFVGCNTTDMQTHAAGASVANAEGQRNAMQWIKTIAHSMRHANHVYLKRVDYVSGPTIEQRRANPNIAGTTVEHWHVMCDDTMVTFNVSFRSDANGRLIGSVELP